MGKKEMHLAFKRICTHFVELGRALVLPFSGNDPIAAHRDGSCMQGRPQKETACRSLEHRLSTAYREAVTQTREEWISLSLLARCLLEGMGEQEKVDREWIAQLLQILPVLFIWKLGKGGRPLLRESGHGER